MPFTPAAAIIIGDEKPGYRLPAAFSLKSIQDALEVEVCRAGQADRILVRFPTVDAARLRESEVRRILGLTTTEVLSVADSRRLKGPLWPQSVYGRVERLAAVAGLVLALVNYWAVFFSAPNIALQSVQAHNVVVGTPARVPFRVVNRSNAEVAVDFDSASAFQFEPAAVELKSRGEADVIMRVAPTMAEGGDVTVSARARSGWLRTRQVVRTTVAIAVWPREQVGAIGSRRLYREGSAAALTLPLTVGQAAPNGLRCEATVTGLAGVTVVGAQPVAEMGTPEVNKQPGNEIAVLWWITPALDGFSERSIQVFLESTIPKSEDEWNAIVPHLQCKRRS
jgi:hypothetical protein